MVPVLDNSPRSGPLGGVIGWVLHSGTSLIYPPITSLVLDQFSGPVVVLITSRTWCFRPRKCHSFQENKFPMLFLYQESKKCGLAPPSNKLEDEFCSYNSSSALASSSLLDNTASIIQTRECDVKGGGPSNIWIGLRVLFFFLFCVCLYLLNKQWRDSPVAPSSTALGVTGITITYAVFSCQDKTTARWTMGAALTSV